LKGGLLVDQINARIRISKDDLDGWKSDPFKARNLFQKIHKKIAPYHFKRQRRVRMFMLKGAMKMFIKRTDKFLAWGDPIE